MIITNFKQKIKPYVKGNLIMLNCGKDGRLMTKDEILEEGHKLIGKTFKDIKNEKNSIRK